MNKERRQTLNNCIRALTSIAADLESLKDQEENALDNMPENLRDSSRCRSMEDAVDLITDALDDIYDARGHLEDID